ncbi:CUE domain-containing protein 1 isoform X2 [Homo sapiens]|uniref:CUE domain-containing protein 1 isoform X2 n=2 Tax=Homo sapiens TaxID=9606 RepID=UPI0005D01469|nr:CUE domain-containing protein 1 isoform X2 [Homo sapiens]XP_054172087.1 CUE domain-containing protein 1 isoform X2 [Homo sapiens]|eukprot:XP_016880130.1 CUE domain-containing protein 1 isoform X2 [Homo sapiens]
MRTAPTRRTASPRRSWKGLWNLIARMKSPHLCTPRQPTTCTCSTGPTLWLPRLRLPDSGEPFKGLNLESDTISIDALGSGAPTSQRRYRNWNPPLLGNLPDDFLRILPQQLDSIQGNAGGPKPGSGEGCPPAMAGPGPGDQESRWKQYLEDERIALFLQNEEFMKELQRNRDFLLALERDRLKYESQKSKSSSVAVGNDFGFSSPVPGTGDANPAVSEDALFRDKLKHMGKSTRRKLFELARAFSEKTKMRKSKRKHLLKHQSLGAAASTANLLDDVEGHACDEDFRGRRQEAPKVEEGLREGQ